MKKPTAVSQATSAILAIADIKTAVEQFEDGEANLFDTLDSVIEIVEAYRAAGGREREQRRRDAA